jgi:hypothetical protein
MTMADTISPPRSPCHIGVVTHDIEQAMEALADRFGVHWNVPSTVDKEYVVSAGQVAWPITVVHSSGPMAIELIEGPPASVWSTSELTRLHHYAFWSSDLEAEVAALQQKGYELELTVADAGGRPSSFAYLVRSGSPRLELIQRGAAR